MLPLEHGQCACDWAEHCLATDTLACEKGNTASLPTRSLARKETLPRYRHARLRERKHCLATDTLACEKGNTASLPTRSLARKETLPRYRHARLRERKHCLATDTLTLPTTTNTINTAHQQFGHYRVCHRQTGHGLQAVPGSHFSNTLDIFHLLTSACL